MHDLICNSLICKCIHMLVTKLKMQRSPYGDSPNFCTNRTFQTGAKREVLGGNLRIPGNLWEPVATETAPKYSLARRGNGKIGNETGISGSLGRCALIIRPATFRSRQPKPAWSFLRACAPFGNGSVPIPRLSELPSAPLEWRGCDPPLSAGARAAPVFRESSGKVGKSEG